jgi:repressor LexA
MNTNEDRPSKKQRELLSFIAAFIKQHGYGPSYREVMNGMAYRSVSTVATHIDNLITKGHLRKRDHSARSLEVVNKPDAEFKETTKVVADDSKWLVEQVAARFDAVEADAKLRKTELDNLYVLVGALHVLGLADAARAFKRRLLKLAK